MTAPRRRKDPTARQRLPLPALVLALIAVAFFALPFVGMLWRTPWSRFWEVLTGSGIGTPLRISITCSLAAAGLSLLFGVPLAWLLARADFPGRSVVRALCTLSMVLPPVIGGVALFFAIGRRGVLGQYLDRWFGITIPFTIWAVVIAQTFVAMPFLVLTVESALRSFDSRFDEAARTLGATRWYAFRRVTLPAIAPSVVAGTVLAWARALGEFGATITFAGNNPRTTETMPIAIYLARERDQPTAIVLSLVLIAVSFVVLVVLRDRWMNGGGRAAPGTVALA
ncbi:ABC transporter permease [Desertimonas flava]|uniref:ABC transporter permease n=1 Tax=Desertimonas flava TaxID=2064846 RepID=UPI001968FF44|nr:ABC transporter permease [Desertimonas flava]